MPTRTGASPRRVAVAGSRNCFASFSRVLPSQCRTPRRAERAAKAPHNPWTPPPGGVEAEQMKIEGSGRGVGVAADRRPRPELADVLDPGVDVAAYVVLVVALEVDRVHGVTGQDQVPEARREPLDLGLDALRHVHRRAGWHVAIGPHGVLPGGGARIVETGRLADQHERPLRHDTGRGGSLGRGHVRERAADVDCARVGEPRVFPWDRAVQRDVQLEGARAVAVAPQLGGVQAREAPKPVAADRQDLTRREVEQDCAVGRQIAQARDPAPGLYLAAQFPQMRCQRIGDVLRTAARNRPADGVSRGLQPQPEAAAQERVQTQHRMGRAAGQDRLRGLRAEATSQYGRRQKRRTPNRDTATGWRRPAAIRSGPSSSRTIQGSFPHDRAEDVLVGDPVAAELVRRPGDVAVDDHSLFGLEGVRERDGRVDPFEAVALQRQRRE